MTTTIVETNSEEEMVMTSLEFSKLTGKIHGSILSQCDKLKKDLDARGEDTKNFKFFEINRKKGGRKSRQYNLTKRHCELLAMGMDREVQIKVYDKMKELEAIINKPMTPLEQAKHQVKLLEEMEVKNKRIATLLDERLNIKSQELNIANRTIGEQKNQIELLNKQSVLDKAMNKLPNIGRLEDTYIKQDFNNPIRLNVYDKEGECLYENITVKEACDLLGTNSSSVYKVMRGEIGSIQGLYQLRRVH